MRPNELPTSWRFTTRPSTDRGWTWPDIELSAFERDLPERVGDQHAMKTHVSAWETRRNGAKVKADWQFTTADARVKLRKLYPTIDH